MATLLFVTTLSLSANPRLYKEILCAHAEGHEVHVVFFRLGNWTDAQDAEKMKGLPRVRFTRLSATRTPFLPWLAGTLMERFCRLIVRSSSQPAICSFAAGKRAFLLELTLRRMRLSPDWVIAHNPAAFLPSARFARRNAARLGIDIEDYHPGETGDPKLSGALRSLLQHTLPESAYVSFAAPLIRREVARDLGGDRAGWVTVLNWFSSAEFPLPKARPTGPLRLVWFSQQVSAQRGLELVLPAIIAQGDSLELHIFGHPDPAFVRDHMQEASNIFLHGPVTQEELHRRLPEFDIGLAIDVVADRNRALAITNKILAYLQAGLYLAVTVTEAQAAFMLEYPGHGMVFQPTDVDWRQTLGIFLDQKDGIRAAQPARHKAMQAAGWEKSASPVIHCWKSTLR